MLRIAPGLLLLALLHGGCRATPRAAPASSPVVASASAAFDPTWTTPPPGSTLPDSSVAVRERVQPEWSANVRTDLFSRYVWRGIIQVDDPVLQPAATVSYGGLSLDVWGNMDLGDANGREGEWNEIDITLDYTHEISDGAVPASLSFGFIYYTSPTGWFRDLAEVYAGVGLDVFLQPQLTVYIGVEGAYEGDGVFVSLDCSHQVPLRCGSLDLQGGISAGNHHFYAAALGASQDALGELYLDAGWLVTAGRWFVRPSVRFSTLVDSALRDAATDNDWWIFGLRVGADF